MFNEKVKSSTKTTSYEGGEVYYKNVENSWSNMLFSMALGNNDTYYESQDSKITRYVDLTRKMVDKYGPEFVGKAAHYARNVLGMRTISELTAAILNEYKFDGKRHFFAKYFRRPDGVGEVFGAVDFLESKRSHALIRGAGDYLSSLDAYTLAKYPMRNHTYNMYDLISLTHANSPVIDEYMRGTLDPPETWESLIHPGISDKEKSKVWKDLVESNKLGYLALIRNLRNICSQDFCDEAWIKKYLCDKIECEQAIKKSLVFPYQIYVAWKSIKDSCPYILEQSLENAFKIATDNVTYYDGSTLLVLDVSGSMEAQFSKNSLLSIKEVSAVYCVSLMHKCEDVTIIKFGTTWKLFNANKSEPIFKCIQRLIDNEDCGYGTRFYDVLTGLYEHYDRIFLFSDMQVMKPDFSFHNLNQTLNQKFIEYQATYGSSHIYSFDLGNYATQVISDNEGITYITALSDQIFTVIREMENSGKSLVKVINEYRY